MPPRRRRKLYEDGLVLRIGPLRKAGLLQPGARAYKVLEISTSPLTLFELEAVSHLDDHGNGRIAARVRPVRCAGRHPDDVITVVIEVRGQPSPWGRGIFLSFICPVTGLRCRTLYMPEGQAVFACYSHWPRDAYAHMSENLSRFRRMVARSRALRAQLGDGGDWLDPVAAASGRYAGVRRERITAKIDALELTALKSVASMASEAAWVPGDPGPDEAGRQNVSSGSAAKR
jgi:hypothetical protein